MFLGHPEARQKYERDVIKSRMSTISDRDADISNKCQIMIDSKFPELDNHRISTLISLMKTTLSYYEVLSQRDLEEVNYYLCLPLAHVFCAVSTEASTVIEAYLALMELPRPKFMSSITEFLAETLERVDRELFEHIAQVNATASTGVSRSNHGDIYCQLDGASYNALFCWYRFHAGVLLYLGPRVDVRFVR